MGIETKSDEIRWQVLKAMLDEFPTLKEKVRKYLKGRIDSRNQVSNALSFCLVFFQKASLSWFREEVKILRTLLFFVNTGSGFS